MNPTRAMQTSRLILPFVLCLLARLASAQITVEPKDLAGADNIPDAVDVETAWYKARFDLGTTGAATAMVYKPANHDLAAENYYARRNPLFAAWIRRSQADPETGATPDNDDYRSQVRLPATYRVLRQSEAEVVLEFTWPNRPPAQDEAEANWLDDLVSVRRVFLRNDTPAVVVEQEVRNVGRTPRDFVLGISNNISLGRVLSAVYLPTPESKLVAMDMAEERGSRFLFAPQVSATWLGGVNAEGLGAAYNVDWRDVDASEISVWKTVGSSYMTHMRRRTAPPGQGVTFRYTFMPFQGLPTLDGMQGDLAGGILVGEKANHLRDVDPAPLPPGEAVSPRVFLVSGHDDKAQVHYRCVRQEDGKVVLDRTIPAELKTAQAAEFRLDLGALDQGLYVLSVTVTGAGGSLFMEKPLPVGRTRQLYAATLPAGDKRGMRDAGLTLGPAPMDPQFTTLDRSFVTPHLPLAKNDAHGPVKAFFLVPADSTLGHVRELAQRVDIEYDYLAIAKIQVPPDSLNEVGLRALPKALAESHPQVLVTPGINWSAGLGDRLSRELLARVEEGMGLVVPARSMKEQVELASALAEHAVEVFDPLPALATVPAEVHRYRLGKGRVVLFVCSWANYRDGGEAMLGDWKSLKTGEQSVAIPQFPWRGFEYSYAWLGQLIRWAGGADSVLTITFARVEGASVSADVLNGAAARAARATVTVRSPRFEIVAQGAADVNLAPGAAQVAVPLNTAPPSGPLAVEITLRDADGKMLAFGSAGVVVSGPAIKLDVTPAYRPVGRPGGCSVEFSGLAAAARLELTVRDAYGRLVASDARDLPAVAEKTRYEIPFQSWSPLCVYHDVQARLSALDERGRPARLLAEDSAPLYLLPDAPAFRDRFVLGVADAPERRALHLQGVIPTVRALGLTLNSHSYYDPLLYASLGEKSAGVQVSAKARYAMPGQKQTLDSKKLIMDPPLVPSPEAVAHGKDAWQKRAREAFDTGVRFIRIDDERRMSDDFDFHPQTLAAFREWLKSQYADIAALNTTWGSNFAAFDAVMPSRRKDLAGSPNLAPWLDFRMFIGDVLGEYYMKKPAEWAVEISPDLAVGEDGIYEPSTAWPVDWSRYARVYRETLRYGDTQGVLEDIFRCFASGTPHGKWQGYGMLKVSPGRRTEVWRTLLKGGHFAWFWAMVDNGYWNYGACTSDQRPTAGYAALAAEEFPDLTGGIDRLIINSTFTDDRIAIGYSYPSWLVDTSGLAAAAKLIVEELGYQHQLVNLTDIAAGRLEKDGFRVLVLQDAACLAVEQAAAIRRFVENGGTLIAVGENGTRDLHGAPHTVPLADAILGLDSSRAAALNRKVIYQEPAWPLAIHAQTQGVALAGAQEEGRASATVLAAVWVDHDMVPLVTVNRVGQGRACWINSTLAGHRVVLPGGVAGEESVALTGPAAVRLSHWRLFDRLLTEAGLAPRCRVFQGGRPVFDTETFYHRSPSGRSLFITRYLSRETTGPLTLRFARPAHIYEMRSRQYFGRSAEVRTDLPPGRVKLFALLEYSVESVQATASKATLRPGETAHISCSIRTSGPAADLHVFRIAVTAPDGKPIACFASTVLAPGGAATVNLPLALDQPPGRYIVTVLDVISGKSGQAAFDVVRE